MSKFQFTDPQATDRTINTSRIDFSGIGEDPSILEGSVSLYDAFSFSRTGSSKIASQRTNTRMRNLKGNLTIKNSNIFEMMKMLALCENRYRNETTKLTKGISRTIFINNVGAVGIIAMLRPVLVSAVRCLKSSYLYRWKSNTGFQRKKSIFPRRKNNARLIGNICRKMVRRAMIKSFIEIRERTCQVQRIVKRRPSVKSPMESRGTLDLRSPIDSRSTINARSSVMSNKSPSPSKTLSSVSIVTERAVEDRTKKEFKQSIQSKYKPENKPLERSMGSSYFRNN